MARERLDGSRPGIGGYQGVFLALTLVVMLVIVMLSKDLPSALLVIGLITNFFIVSSQLTLLGDRQVADAERRGPPAPGLSSAVFDSPAGVTPEGAALLASLGGSSAAERLAPGREAFAPAPPAFPVVPATWGGLPGPYPGAIDFDGEAGPGAPGEEAPALGHLDLSAAARDGAPEGNPFETGRVAAPYAAAPCVDDDAISGFDGDEQNTYQARSRNDPTRVWAGVFRRKELIDRYVRSELDERENCRWWGVHEV